MFTILIVDDDLVNCKILEKIFNNDKTIIANSGYEALSILEKEIPDIILLDIMMPGINGLETAKKIFENYNTYNIPIIFISASNNQETILECFRIGAVDFIKKPYEMEEVIARVESHVKMSIKVKAKSDLINYDILTGALNRRVMEETLEYNLELLKRNKDCFSLCYLDLDKFKELNDTYGHKAGDVELINVVNSINGMIRKTDLLFRLGGDEFLIFFNNTTEEQAHTAIGRIKKSKVFSLDFSYGIIQVSNGNQTVDEIIRLADSEMYKDKKNKK